MNFRYRSLSLPNAPQDALKPHTQILQAFDLRDPRLWSSMHAQTRHIGHQESESLQKKLPQGYHSPINTGMTGGGYMLLKDKIAVVTGANRGLGKAVALRFAEEGAKVMLVGRNTEALQAVQKMIEAKGGAAEVFCADVTDRPQLIKWPRRSTSPTAGQIFWSTMRGSPSNSR